MFYQRVGYIDIINYSYSTMILKDHLISVKISIVKYPSLYKMLSHNYQDIGYR